MKAVLITLATVSLVTAVGAAEGGPDAAVPAVPAVSEGGVEILRVPRQMQLDPRMQLLMPEAIDGEQVEEKALRDGDLISLGGLELTYKEA